MTGHHAEVDDAALARELEALVSTEPSRALVARVRQRVAAEPAPARGLPWGWLGVAAAVAVVVVAVVAARPARVAPEPSTASPPTQVVRVPAVEPPVEAPPAVETAPAAPVAEPAAPEVVASAPTGVPAGDVLAPHLAGPLRLAPVLFRGEGGAPVAGEVASSPLRLARVVLSPAESAAFQRAIRDVRDGRLDPSRIEPTAETLALNELSIEPITVLPLEVAALLEGEGQ